MKKYIKMVSFLALFTFAMGTSMNCYGRFVLTKKIYNWNGTVGDKFVNTAVMWVLFILPIYQACGTLDFVLLNTIEFWTGSNPLAMGPDDSETKIVKKEGQELEITATQNKMVIKSLSGDNKGKVTTMVFSPVDESWYLEEGDSYRKMVEVTDKSTKTIKLYHPDGQSVDVQL
ncbi:MAG: DUF3332 domain-containing protein [Spirochaetia bacterium]|nr:DUF3332 domain-containing protein [Spirochaetia bacterium]